MKTASVTTAINLGENTSFYFNFCPIYNSASIKAWEEENLEYSSWNLIVDQQDSVLC